MSDDQQGPLGEDFDSLFRPGSSPRRAADEPDLPRRGYDDEPTHISRREPDPELPGPLRASDPPETFAGGSTGETFAGGSTHETFAGAGHLENDVADDSGADEPVGVAAAPAPPRGHPFTRSLGWTALGTFLPGLGLLPTRARRWGIALFVVVLLAGAGLVWYVLRDPFEAAKIATRTDDLLKLCVGLVVLAVLWVLLVAGTHLLTRPRQLTTAQRLAGGLAVGLLSFVVATPLAVGARYSWDQVNLVNNVFGKNDKKPSQTRPTIDTDQSSDEVWKKHPRLNILLVGLDNSAEREYQDVDQSTDTMMVASIDTQTGDMVLVQVPRNMAKTPFPPGSELARIYPDGYTDGHGDNAAYFANAIWAHVPAEHPDLFANTDYPGADALKLGMEGALGLKIDYFVALNIDGLVGLIDAMGGVTVNVNERLPIGGDKSRGIPPSGYLEPGANQKLSGYYAMWYARSRQASTDFDRMSRQSCVIQAVVNQADPQTMLTRYEAIARAGTNAVSTDIPSNMLPHLVTLAERVKNGKMNRVLFVHDQNGYVTYDPDFEMMQRRVADAITNLGGTAPSMPLVTPTPTPTQQTTMTSPSPNPTVTKPGASPTATEPSTPKPIEDLADACAYNPK